METVDMGGLVGRPGERAVYKLLDKNYNPLYVGVTSYPLRRIANHFDNKYAQWTKEVRHIHYEWMPETIALLAERGLILALQPKHNNLKAPLWPKT